MKYLIIILLIFLVPTIFASCSEGQIDINSASLKELDNLYGIGEAKAENIINARPFDSVDDLVKVSGIAEKTLEKIKEKGLACVGNLDENSNEENNKESDSDEGNEEPNSDEKEEKEDTDSKYDEITKYENLVSSESGRKSESTDKTQIETINLNSKDIKTGNSLENNEPGKNLAAYGLLSFCILLGFLFGIKKLKLKNYKNEFE